MQEAINTWLAGLVAGAVGPAVATAGALLDPARLTDTGALHQLWAETRAIANTIFVLLVLAGGVTVLGFETVQTRYAIKQIAPRLVFGWLAANLSWPLITTLTQLGAALAVAVAGSALHPADILTQLVAATTSDGPTFMVILAGVVAVLALVLTLTLIVVIAVLLGLTVLAPLALCLHALPHTEAIAWWWWRTFTAALAIPTLHALLLALLARVLLTPGGLAVGVFGVPIGAAAPGSLLDLLVVIALLYLMIKIPGWVLRGATGSRGRGGVLRGVLSSAVLSAGLAALGVPLPVLAGRGGGVLAGRAALGLAATARRGPTGFRGSSPVPGRSQGRPSRAAAPPPVRPNTTAPHRGGGPGPSAGAGTAGEDPYARVRVGRGGQLLLPLPGLSPSPHPHGAPPRAPAGPTRRAGRAGEPPSAEPRARGRQLRLPLGRDWPEQRPVLGRDGQYRLPIHPPRTRRAPARHLGRATGQAVPRTPGPPGSSGAPGPGQMPLPLIWPTPPRRRARDGQPPRPSSRPRRGTL